MRVGARLGGRLSVKERHDRVAGLGGGAFDAAATGCEVGAAGSFNACGGGRVAERSGEECCRKDRGGRVCLLLTGDIGCRAVYGFEHAREGAFWVDVPGCGETNAARDGSGKVREDVSEEVIGDDDVEAARVLHEEDRGRVNVQVVDGDLGEVLRDLVHDPLPHVAGVHEDVLLVDEREALAWAGLSLLEGEADESLDAEGRVDARLVRDLEGRAGADGAAVADVGPFRPFTDDEEVDIAGLRERAFRARIERRRAEVHVVVEGEAELEEHPAFDKAAREARVGRVAADRTEEDRVVLTERFEVFVVEDAAGLEVVTGSEGVLVFDKLNLIEGERCAEHLTRFGRHLRPDSISGDDCEVERVCHRAALSACCDAQF